MIRSIVFVCCLWLLPVLLLGAERPTAEQVARSVEQSRTAHARDYPPRSQAEVLAGYRRVLARARKLAPKDLPALSGTEFREHKAAAIQEWVGKIKETEANYVPFRRLAAVEWHELPVGSVGYLGPSPRDRVRNACGLNVVQILGTHECLAEYFVFDKPFASNTTAPRAYTGALFLLRGVPTEQMTEGHQFYIQSGEGYNVVRVGSYAYLNSLGTQRTVPILELFDPNQPFE